MKKLSFLSRIIQWFLRFIQVQLFVTTVSLPILISWGLPISVISPIGNLIFFPVLVLFLLISSVIFFLEIMFIPNIWLIYILEKLTYFWDLALSYGSSTKFLIGFAQPSPIILLSIPFFAFMIIKNNRTNSVGKSILYFTMLLFCTFAYLKFCNFRTKFFENIECNNGQISLIHDNGKTVLVDPGVIGRKLSAQSWVEYTLAPKIIKKTGHNLIDHLIILQPGILTFNAIEKLCGIMNIKTIHLIVWDGTFEKNGWRSFFSLKSKAKEQNTKFVRIGRKKSIIELSEKTEFIIEPLKQVFKYQKATYPAVSVTGQIDNKSFTIYSAKYKKNKKKGVSENEIV